MRKIIHIDMDAFYASVELRERPELRHLPVVVSSHHPRAVICAASYPAREFGLRSAMPMSQARKLCPQVTVIEPDFEKYRAVSAQIHAVFRRYTAQIEPLSLDEAYLDVTENLQNIASATEAAMRIRADIFQATGLTASAGVAPNKFLAKVASDWNKPDGICVIKPSKVQAFIHGLPLHKIPGVGKVTLQKMNALGMHTAGDLRGFERGALLNHFGRYGYRLYDLARGIDERPVKPSRERLQISTEITLPEDLPLAQIARHLPHLAEDLWRQTVRKNVQARTVTLKLKTTDFRTITRSLTYSSALPDAAALAQAAAALMKKVPPSADDAYRLIGIGVGHLLPSGQQQSLWQEAAEKAV